MDRSWDLSWRQKTEVGHSCCRVEVTERVNQREKERNMNACLGERVLGLDKLSLRMGVERGSEKDLGER